MAIGNNHYDQCKDNKFPSTIHFRSSYNYGDSSIEQLIPTQDTSNFLREYCWKNFKIRIRGASFQRNFFLPLLLTISLILLSASRASATNHPDQANTENQDAALISNLTQQRRLSRNINTEDQNPPFILRPEHFIVPCGSVVHIFPRYGYFSLSMRVMAKGDRSPNSPHSDSNQDQGRPSPLQRNESWMFIEPANNVIEPSTLKIEERSFTTNNENDALPFQNLYHFDLCEDVKELTVAYFKNFTIEGLDKPWQAFSGGWRVPSTARYFGIDQMYVEGDYRFILVKIFLVRGTGTAVPLQNITVSPLYKPYFKRFRPNDDLSSYEFFKIVGTHYVHSYATGNAIYQVFVYDPDGFQTILKHLFYDGSQDRTSPEFLHKLPDVLAKGVTHFGRVFVLSSSQEVTDSVRTALATHPMGPYSAPIPSLFKLHNNSELVAELEQLLASEPTGILGIDMRSIDFLFENPMIRAGFEKALKHKIQLWEINFRY